MSLVLETSPETTRTTVVKRLPWVVWDNGDARIRVQINEPVLAKAFVQMKGVTRIAYSVNGPFTQIFLTDRSRESVQTWMKSHNNRTTHTSGADTESTERKQ